jgi:transposase
MAKPLVSDELWAEVARLLPPKRPKPKGGRPPVPDRQALTGIFFVLKTGIQWEDLVATRAPHLPKDDANTGPLVSFARSGISAH